MMKIIKLTGQTGGLQCLLMMQSLQQAGQRHMKPITQEVMVNTPKDMSAMHTWSYLTATLLELNHGITATGLSPLHLTYLEPHFTKWNMPVL